MSNIKLLSKNEISKAQNVDRAKEIAEGLKISRRVDGLRELQSKEEKVLEKFRTESLAAIGKEIAELSKKRDALVSETISIREELKGETALSREERLDLEKLKSDLLAKERQLTAKAEKLALDEIDIAIATKEAMDSVEQARNHREEARIFQEKASHERAEASETLQKARKIEEVALRDKKEGENSLALREVDISIREKTFWIREANHLTATRELEQEKVQLADQRKTLERALERIKNNRLA